MPTPTELLREQVQRLENLLVGMAEREAAGRRQLEYLEGLADRQREELAALRTEIATLRQEIALAKQRQDDLLQRVEKWGGRAWGLVAVLVGALLSLASGLILTLARKGQP